MDAAKLVSVTDSTHMSSQEPPTSEAAAGGEKTAAPPPPTELTQTSETPTTELEPTVASSEKGDEPGEPQSASAAAEAEETAVSDSGNEKQPAREPVTSADALPAPPSPTVTITATPEPVAQPSPEPGEKMKKKPSAPPPTTKPPAPMQMQCKQCHRLGGNHEDWCSFASGSPPARAALSADNPLSMGRYGEFESRDPARPNNAQTRPPRPTRLRPTSNARESWRRIDKFANLDEIQEGYYSTNAAGGGGSGGSTETGAGGGGSGGGGLVLGGPHRDVVMAINGSSFSWGTEEPSEETAAAGKGKGKGKSKSKGKGKGKGKGKEAVETDEKAVELEAGTKKDDLEESTRSVTAKVLNDVHVSIARGELVAVVGRVGSGKTALAAAFLGELKKWGGDVTLNGTVAYMAQTPWILNETLRQNVVFGGVHDEARYKRAIRVSCLEHDLDTLPNGDQTEIGERGINLSGGQKARVSIARGVYSQADIFIFDDPLSALDAEVGHKIFEELIVKELAGKVGRACASQHPTPLDLTKPIIACGTTTHHPPPTTHHTAPTTRHPTPTNQRPTPNINYIHHPPATDTLARDQPALVPSAVRSNRGAG